MADSELSAVMAIQRSRARQASRASFCKVEQAEVDSGMLMKQGIAHGFTMPWRKRFFKLTGVMLRWYESEKQFANGTAPRGEMECKAISGVLEGAALVIVYGEAKQIVLRGDTGDVGLLATLRTRVPTRAAERAMGRTSSLRRGRSSLGAPTFSPKQESDMSEASCASGYAGSAGSDNDGSPRTPQAAAVPAPATGAAASSGAVAGSSGAVDKLLAFHREGAREARKSQARLSASLEAADGGEPLSEDEGVEAVSQPLASLKVTPSSKNLTPVELEAKMRAEMEATMRAEMEAKARRSK